MLPMRGEVLSAGFLKGAPGFPEKLPYGDGLRIHEVCTGSFMACQHSCQKQMHLASMGQRGPPVRAIQTDKH